MAQCEMCGTEVASPTTVKVEGAEIEVCDDCTSFGTEVRTESSSGSSTKYSTSSSGSSSGGSGSPGSDSSKGSRRRRDMFDEMEEVAQDYDERIRRGRESAGLTQEELANALNEKASLIRKLERGEVLPSDSVQNKLERKLDISLVESPGGDEEWESEGSAGTTTLGDVVRRKD